MAQNDGAESFVHHERVLKEKYERLKRARLKVTRPKLERNRIAAEVAVKEMKFKIEPPPVAKESGFKLPGVAKRLCRKAVCVSPQNSADGLHESSKTKGEHPKKRGRVDLPEDLKGFRIPRRKPREGSGDKGSSGTQNHVGDADSQFSHVETHGGARQCVQAPENDRFEGRGTFSGGGNVLEWKELEESVVTRERPVSEYYEPLSEPEYQPNTIYVANVPDDRNEDDLRDLFDEFGEIVSVRIQYRGRKQAFVEFASAEAAKKTISSLHLLPAWDSHTPLRVSRARRRISGSLHTPVSHSAGMYPSPSAWTSSGRSGDGAVVAEPVSSYLQSALVGDIQMPLQSDRQVVSYDDI